MHSPREVPMVTTAVCVRCREVLIPVEDFDPRFVLDGDDYPLTLWSTGDGTWGCGSWSPGAPVLLHSPLEFEEYDLLADLAADRERQAKQPEGTRP